MPEFFIPKKDEPIRIIPLNENTWIQTTRKPLDRNPSIITSSSFVDRSCPICDILKSRKVSDAIR